jgi:hypothetical protein
MSKKLTPRSRAIHFDRILNALEPNSYLSETDISKKAGYSISDAYTYMKLLSNEHPDFVRSSQSTKQHNILIGITKLGMNFRTYSGFEKELNKKEKKESQEKFSKLSLYARGKRFAEEHQVVIYIILSLIAILIALFSI